MTTSITPLAMNTTKLEFGIIVKVWIVEQYKCINDNVVKWDHNVYCAPDKTPEMWEKLKTFGLLKFGVYMQVDYNIKTPQSSQNKFHINLIEFWFLTIILTWLNNISNKTYKG